MILFLKAPFVEYLMFNGEFNFYSRNSALQSETCRKFLITTICITCRIRSSLR